MTSLPLLKGDPGVAGQLIDSPPLEPIRKPEMSGPGVGDPSISGQTLAGVSLGELDEILAQRLRAGPEVRPHSTGDAQNLRHGLGEDIVHRVGSQPNAPRCDLSHCRREHSLESSNLIKQRGTLRGPEPCMPLEQPALNPDIRGRVGELGHCPAQPQREDFSDCSRRESPGEERFEFRGELVHGLCAALTSENRYAAVSGAGFGEVSGMTHFVGDEMIEVAALRWVVED